MVKSFASNANIRNEYFRDQNFAVDMMEIHLQNSSGAADPLYLSTGMLDISYDSPTATTAGANTYSAQGEFMGYSSITEEFDVVLGRFTINLSGLPANYIDRFINKENEGKRVVVYKTFLNANTLQIIENPIMMFDGEIYNIIIQQSQETCGIAIECSSIFSDFERYAGRNTNNWSNWSYQGVQYDTSMEKTGFIGNTEFLWGRLS
jgi:hypothetical protein